MRFTLLFALFFYFTSYSQIIDFENVADISPGDPLGKITLSETGCAVQFYSGHDLKDTIPLTLQQVAYDAGNGGFYGPKWNQDCKGNTIKAGWINQINASNYALNKKVTNRKRVGCYFISGILKGDVLPSIFIQYDSGTKSCSADLLDVDGHDNTIEAYDIYCYATNADYPLNPINIEPIKIRSIGKTTGDGVLGDNGGLMPFNIAFDTEFTILEIRPIQQVSGRNDVRNEFGFALDNFSPCGIESAPYTPPYLDKANSKKVEIENLSPPLEFTVTLIEEKPKVESPVSRPAKIPTIDPIYFEYDAHSLSAKGTKILDSLIAVQQEFQQQKLTLAAYCDPKGLDAYNVLLSKKRGEAVANYLISGGYPKTQITVTHFGEAYKGDVNDPDWKKRVVILEVGY